LIPIEGEPKVVEMVSKYAEWLAKSDTPKLLINAETGIIFVGKSCYFCRTWPNQEGVTVMGKYFIEEDSPGEIGQPTAKFIHMLNPMTWNSYMMAASSEYRYRKTKR
jgi:haloalkane dehalogenase